MLIFADGFESGSLAAWSGNVTTGGCTTNGGDTNPYTGNFNLKSTIPNGIAAGAFAVAYFGSMANAYLHLFARTYVKFNNLPEANADVHAFLGFWENTNSNSIARAGIVRVGAVSRFGVRGISTGTTFANTQGTIVPVINTWYCFEFEIVIANLVGAYRVYINGRKDVEVTGVSNNARANNYFHAGLDNLVAAAGSDTIAYLDNVVLSTERIGCIMPTFMKLTGRGMDRRSHLQPRRWSPQAGSKDSYLG